MLGEGRGSPGGDLRLTVDEGMSGVLGMIGVMGRVVGMLLMGHVDGYIDLSSPVLLMPLWLLLVERRVLMNFPSVYEAPTGISHPQSL